MLTLVTFGILALGVVVAFAAVLALLKLAVLLVLLPLRLAFHLVLLPLKLLAWLILLPVFLLLGVLGVGAAAIFAVPLVPLALVVFLAWLLMRRAPSARVA